jgi:hypothetical protein
MSPRLFHVRRCTFLPWIPAVALAFVVGCDSKKSQGTVNQIPAGTSRDAEATALLGLEEQPDANQCRTALQLLDNTDSVTNRPTLSQGERDDLAAFLGLKPEEVAEAVKPTFSQSDAAYLEECLLVRAGMRSLRIDGRPPLERGRLGFDWACRMVYVDNRVPWTANPWTTLEAGSGVALSRAYVVLAVWQQLGLDGYLIGPPALKITPSIVSPTAAGGSTAYAPVRACGLKVGGDVFLFDHSSGQAIATADGKGTLTLAQAKAAPDLLKALAGVDEVKTWQPYLPPPLNGLSRRMEWLERFNPANADAKLFVDVLGQRSRFTADLPGQLVDAWNVDGDVHSATRILGRYSTDEPTARAKVSLRDEHRVRMVPLEFRPRTNLIGEAAGHLSMAFGRSFERLRYSINSPRDSVLRGHFQEATRVLEDTKKTIEFARTRFEQDKELQKDFEVWADEFQRLSANIIRARRPGDPAGLQAAAQELDYFRKLPRNQDIERAYVLGQAARPLGAEIAFLMATCVHERAERSQLEDSAKAASNWQNAQEWWERYLDVSAQAQSPFPAREAHGRALQTRCKQFTGK